MDRVEVVDIGSGRERGRERESVLRGDVRSLDERVANLKFLVT